MLRQIDSLCVPQLADTGRLEADHNGGYSRVHRRSGSVTERDPISGSARRLRGLGRHRH